MLTLTLLRHTSVDVPPGVCYGHTDVPLRDSFPEEAARTAASLAGERFDAVYTSPLSRATRLADYCGYPDAVRDDRLKELNFGRWEMQRFDDITDPRLSEWYADYENVRATDGESFADQYARVAAFLDELRSLPHRRVAIFAHGGVLLCAQIYAGVLPKEKAFSSLTPYGGKVVLELGLASDNTK